MTGRPKEKLRKKQELEVHRDQRRITDEHVEIARAYEDGDITEAEYRQELLNMDYGEIQRLWRVKHLRCANPQDLTEQQVNDVAIRAHGIVIVMARILGLNRYEVSKLIKKYKTVTRTMAEERENIVDLAEARLFESANLGQEWAIKMILYCQGKYRGWTKEISPTENKGKILEAMEKLTGGMGEDELLEYDKQEGL